MVWSWRKNLREFWLIRRSSSSLILPEMSWIWIGMIRSKVLLSILSSIGRVSMMCYILRIITMVPYQAKFKCNTLSRTSLRPFFSLISVSKKCCCFLSDYCVKRLLFSWAKTKALPRFVDYFLSIYWALSLIRLFSCWMEIRKNWLLLYFSTLFLWSQP